MRASRRRSTILAAPCALVAIALAVAVAAGAFSRSSDVRTVRADGYVAPLRFDDQLRLDLNTVVARVMVVDVGRAHYLASSGGGLGESVYTPVTARVVRTYRGGLAAGSTVVLRALGGTAAGVRFETNVAPAEGVKSIGRELIVFGSRPAIVGDERAPAMTPNGWYLIRGGSVGDVTYAAPPPQPTPGPALTLERVDASLSSLDG